MATIRTSNNPEMLIWAREEIGYTVPLAAEAIGISEEQLKKAEAGEYQLTLSQLRKAAEVYDFPFGYFYLSQQPKEKEYKPVPDYRTDPKYAGINHFRTNLEIKKCRERRANYMDLAANIGLGLQPFNTLTNVQRKNIGAHIRERLNISPSQLSRINYSQIYSYWRSKIEEDGVLVYETQYIPKETGIIGASLYYVTCPIILIRKGKEFNQRKLFTLLHEYAHLLLGESAINDVDSLTALPARTGEDIEFRCNRLASEILVPSELVDTNKYRGMAPKLMMEALSSEFKVTYSSAAVCLKKQGLITQEELDYLLELRRQEHLSNTINDQEAEIKIPREIVMKANLGKPMFDLVLSAYNSGHLDLYDASRLLHLRVNKIDKLLGVATQ